MTQGVVFDLDGTLIDSLHGIAIASNQILASQGFPTHDLIAFREFIGKGVHNLFKLAIDSPHNDAAVIEQCANQFRIVYAECWKEYTTIYDGITDLLSELERRKISINVLSNKPHANTVECVDHLLSPWKFDMVIGHRFEVPPKPDPTSALRIAQNVGYAPEAFVLVGDSTVDMQTGLNAKMTPMAVSHGFESTDNLRAAGAVQILKEPLELIAYLEGRP